MNKLLKTLLLSLAIVSLLFSANAQENSDEPTVQTKYDQSKDETEVEMSQLSISVDKSKMALLSVSASFRGKKISTPDDIIFVVSVVSIGGYKYPKINNVKLISDGKSLGGILMLNLDQRKFSDTESLETIGTRMRFELFKKFVEAKEITFKMGDSKFLVEQSQLLKLLEFKKAIDK